MEAILQQPQHPDVVSASGSSPLIEASLHCHVEVVRLLLEAGADKDLTNNDGISALMRASLCGHVEVVRLLLEAGADKNSTCNDGLSALRLASVLGHVEVVRLLLDAGADKNSAGTPGITALVLAASAGHAEVLRLLLDAGAGKSSTCNDGRTALVLASGKGNVEALRLLLDADVGTTFPYLSVCIALMEACYQRHAATVHLLLRWLLEKATPKLLVGCVLPAATVAASAADPVVVISSGDMSATNNRHCWTLGWSILLVSGIGLWSYCSCVKMRKIAQGTSCHGGFTFEVGLTIHHIVSSGVVGCLLSPLTLVNNLH